MNKESPLESPYTTFDNNSGAVFPSLWEGLGEGLPSTIFPVHWRWRQLCFDNEVGIRVVEVKVDDDRLDQTVLKFIGHSLSVPQLKICTRRHHDHQQHGQNCRATKGDAL